MSLTVHATIGAVIGLSTSNPVLGFLAGILSHFVSDVIPHGDEALEEWYKKKDLKKLIPALSMDLSLTMLFLFVIFNFYQPLHTLVVTLSILGAVFPDFWTPLYKTTGWQFMLPFVRFHDENHELLGEKYRITLTEGAVVQVIFWLLLWGQISSRIT